MFICDPCARERNRFIVTVSYGACDFCGKTAECADIHHSCFPVVERTDKNGNFLTSKEQNMSDDRISMGFAIKYKHVSGRERLSPIAPSEILAKANYLNQWLGNIDKIWTAKKVEDAWASWVKIHDAQVVEVYVRPC